MDLSKNIILIGMPGCGKTTVGRILAANSGRLFVDCDNTLVETAGLSIPEIFEREGEEGFRKRETEILKDICRQSGLIIATGGGCVTQEENYSIIKQNGIIIFLERPLSLLERKGRPLSTGELGEMHRQRLHLYQRFADYTFQNNEAAKITAENILQTVKEVTGI
jgi:shikimate dehydrogenase